MQYVDRTRGPFNEGGLYAERQGWHYPGFDTGKWEKQTPFEGIKTAGVGFFEYVLCSPITSPS